jgi:peptidoglycan/xylan/chitin deacetylase (PgdA/CDA1 family)
MDRRGFLSLAAVAAGTGLLLPEMVGPLKAASAAETDALSPETDALSAKFGALSTDFESLSATTKLKPRYPSGVIWNLPSKWPKVAWTIDDGGSAQALHNYIDFAHDTGTRLTFFVTSQNKPWRTVKKELLPLVKTGQIQLANHTRSHLDLTKLAGWQIRRELRDCRNFIQDEYGVTPAPIFRPPFGYYDKRVMHEAAVEGWRSCVMWYGTLGDGSGITAARRLQLASQWMTAGHLVIAHSNQVTSPSDLRRIRRMLDSRGLRTVTLDDTWRA